MLLADKVGRLRVGATADITILRDRALPTEHHVYTENRVVFAAGGTHVETVIVDGRVVFSDGAPAGVNEAGTRAELGEYAEWFERTQAAVEGNHAELATFFDRLSSGG